MFERFTERSRHVVVLAQEESRTLKHNYIGTEHILLGLLREQEGLAARVLESLEITVERVRWQVVRIVGSGEEPTTGQIPFTPRSKRVLELALAEALSFGHNYIGTEHILLGLVREHEGIAMRILLDFNADAEKIRHELIPMLPKPGNRQQSSGSGPGLVFHQAGTSMAPWLKGFEQIVEPLAQQIRRELGRDPDAGDLLLALVSVRNTVPGEAFQVLGVGIDELSNAIERAREQLREEERQLPGAPASAERVAAFEAETLAEICRRLGIPPTDTPPPPQEPG